MRTSSLFALMALLASLVIISGCETSGAEESAKEDTTSAADTTAGQDTATGDEDVTSEDTASSPDTAEPPKTCEPMTDKSCVSIKRGESVYYRFLADYDTVEFDDEGTLVTVVPLAELIDAEVTDDPGAWRFQVTGTDGYTNPDFISWDQLQLGYIEPGTRRVSFDEAAELIHSFFVKDTYLITMYPAQ